MTLWNKIEFLLFIVVIGVLIYLSAQADSAITTAENASRAADNATRVTTSVRRDVVTNRKDLLRYNEVFRGDLDLRFEKMVMEAKQMRQLVDRSGGEWVKIEAAQRDMAKQLAAAEQSLQALAEQVKEATGLATAAARQTKMAVAEAKQGIDAIGAAHTAMEQRVGSMDKRLGETSKSASATATEAAKAMADAKKAGDSLTALSKQITALSDDLQRHRKIAEDAASISVKAQQQAGNSERLADQLAKKVEGLAAVRVPIGAIIAWTGSPEATPHGYLRCNGDRVPDGEPYAPLRAALKAAGMQGDRLPDMAGLMADHAAAERAGTPAREAEVSEAADAPTEGVDDAPARSDDTPDGEDAAGDSSAPDGAAESPTAGKQRGPAVHWLIRAF